MGSGALLVAGTTSDAGKSAQLVEQLIAQQKVHAVIGGYGSQLVQAQSVVPERYGVPFITGGAGASSIYGRSKWVFGTLSPVESLAQTQMEFLADLQKSGKLKTPLKISLLKENTEHGRDFDNGVTTSSCVVAITVYSTPALVSPPELSAVMNAEP